MYGRRVAVCVWDKRRLGITRVPRGEGREVDFDGLLDVFMVDDVILFAGGDI